MKKNTGPYTPTKFDKIMMTVFAVSIVTNLLVVIFQILNK